MTHDICDQYTVILKVLSMRSDDVVANRIKTNQYGCNGLGTCLHKSFSKLWLVLRWDFLVERNGHQTNLFVEANIRYGEEKVYK